MMVRFQATQSTPCPKLDAPAAISLILGSVHFISLAASSAKAPYSAALRWPICHGPSISLPSPQYVTFHGASRPFCLRRRVIAVSSDELQYSTHCCASFQVPVPRLQQMYGSVFSASAYCRNSWVPKRLLSTVPQAISNRGGRLSRGPIPSIQ